jgi:hypothetical protein
MFFTFPEDARSNEALNAVEFGVEISEYAGVVRVPRRVFQGLLAERPTPKMRGRLLSPSNPVRANCRTEAASQLIDDGNVDHRSGSARADGRRDHIVNTTGRQE